MRTHLLIAMGCITACASPDDAGSLDDGKSDGASSIHLRAVVACDRALETSTVDRIAALEAHTACVRDANTAAAPIVDELMTFPADDPTEVVFDRLGDAEFQLCRALEDATESEGKREARASCDSGRARDLARLIDGYVLFGDDLMQPAFEPDRTLAPDCYEAYDAATASAETINDGIAAAGELEACVIAEIDVFSANFVEALARTGEPEAARVERAQRVVRDQLAGSATVCEQLAAAGGAGGGNLEGSFIAGCRADRAAMLHEQLVESLFIED